MMLPNITAKQKVKMDSRNINNVFTNPGLLHVGKNILRFLSVKNLAKYRLVSTSWRNLIDNYKPWLIYLLEYIHGVHGHEKIFTEWSIKGKPKVKETIRKRFPEWNAFIKQSSKTVFLSIPELQKFIIQLWKYFNDESESYNRSPFHSAVAKSDVRFVQRLIDFGIDLEMKGPRGWTSMHYACRYGKIKMITFLTKNLPNFDAKVRTKRGETIFHLAVQNKDPQVSKQVLVKFRIFRFENMIDENGWSLVHTAAAWGPSETIRFLFESRHTIGFNIDARTNRGSTILHIACRYRAIEIVDLVFNLLQEVNSGINFDTQDNHNAKPLHYHAVELAERF